MEYPAEFLENMKTLLEEEYPSFRESLDRDCQRALRINPLRREVCLPMVSDAVAWEPFGRYVADGFRPGKDIAHFAGAYYMQDASAMAPARALNPQPGEIILDLCAAPGGKSGQIAAMLNRSGALVSNEPDFSRAQALRGNLERLGASCAATICQLPHQISNRFEDAFDGVLVDAPCSGEGMFRRDPQARLEWSPEKAAGCARRQREILCHAARMVRPGGRLTYSTCTFNRGENEDNVQYLLREFPDFAPGVFSLPGIGASRNGCLRLWPHKIRGEGHFIALLVRKGDASRTVKPRLKPSKEAVNALSMLTDALPGTWFEPFKDWNLYLKDDLLIAQPPQMPDLSGLRVLGSGVGLCRVGRGYVKPEHALAMAMDCERIKNRQPLTDREAQAFLRGETIPSGLSGWTLATWNGLALGWGKATQGTLKNHLPKGLRI